MDTNIQNSKAKSIEIDPKMSQDNGDKKAEPATIVVKQVETSKSLRKKLPVSEKKYPKNCRFCGKMFKQSNLKVHEMLHTGDIAVKCHICDKGFVQKGNYRLHMRTTHGQNM